MQAFDTFQLYAGIEYIYMSTTQPNTVATTTATLTASNAMLGLKYVFGKSGLFSISAMAAPTAQANYQVSGSPGDLWSGSAHAAKISISPELTSYLKLTVSVMYYSATYNSKNSTAGSTTVNSFSRNLLLPTVGLQFNF